MKRKKGKTRHTNPRVLILTDGETERNYFLAIKEDTDYKRDLAALTVKVFKTQKQASLEMIEEARKKMKTAEKEGNEFDAIWLVFDHDHNPKRKEVWEAAKKENFKVAFSSIAFEQWYLLHFSQTARRFENAAALIKILKKHLPLYEKAKQNDFTLLKNHLENACKNAAWLRKTNFDEFKHVTDHNPWTNVDELVLFLVNLGK